MDRWQQYLFESHPETVLREWAQRLAYFRFFRAFGGHANDGDSLDVAYRYETTEQLEAFLSALGVTLFRFEEKPPQAEIGVSYSGAEFAKFPSLIAGTEWIRQPGRCVIAEQPAFVWCANHLVKISVGADYAITAADVRAAEIIEQRLAKVALERVDPPLDSRNYVCPKYYPAYFTA